jgi:hypothetical protein
MLYANPAIVLKNSCKKRTIHVSQQFSCFPYSNPTLLFSHVHFSLLAKATHPEQHEYPKQFHPEPNQRPLHQDEQHTSPERKCALPLLFAREEDKCPLRAEQQRDSDQEEDVAHCQQGAVEEEDQAEEEEEAAAAAESDADLC